MKHSISYYLDGQNEPKPINITLNCGGKRFRYFTGYRIESDKFSTEKQEVKKNASGYFGKTSIKYNQINLTLAKLRVELTAMIQPMKTPPTRTEISSVILQITGRYEKNEHTSSLNFWNMYEEFISTHKSQYNTYKQHKACRNHLKNYEEYLFSNNRDFKGFDFYNISPDILRNFKSWLLKDSFISTGKTTRTARGENTVACIFKAIRAFFYWSIDRIEEKNSTIEIPVKIPDNPFKRLSKEEKPREQYSSPIYLTIKERDYLASYDAQNKRLNKVRDMFIFQCLTGCRVGDLLRLRKSNIKGNVLEFIPNKTSNERQDVITIPLIPQAIEILNRYDEPELIFPSISDVKYNLYLKELFEKAGLDRMVTRTNPRSRQEEQIPLYKIVASHLARKTFIGLLYGTVKDDVICSMSGHKEGSKAFLRYRKVDDKMKLEAVKTLQPKEPTREDLFKKLENLSDEEIKKLLSKI